MRIAGLQKLTLLDFPGKTAATVFTPGCNFRCPFCHNADLVCGAGASERAANAEAAVPDETAGATPDVPLDEFFAFLDKRKGLLDGVCVTGGEPLMQPGLADFCARVRKAGFAVKLDTNGSFPGRLREIVEAGLVDYVAMDVKNAPARYAETAGVPGLDVAPVQESIAYLLDGPVPFEFRTTVARELHSADDLRALAQWIEGAPAWFLQNYQDGEGVIAGPGRFHAWNPDDLHALLPELQAIVPTARLRGVG